MLEQRLVVHPWFDVNLCGPHTQLVSDVFDTPMTLLTWLNRLGVHEFFPPFIPSALKAVVSYHEAFHFPLPKVQVTSKVRFPGLPLEATVVCVSHFFHSSPVSVSLALNV